jgi:peptidoglycan/LPS O-acetylase OafA/YrhL
MNTSLHSGQHSTRILGLDVIRAVAVLLVVCQHGLVLIAPYVSETVRTLLLTSGVDLFFVLSGYLIGGILLDMLAAGGAGARSIGRFWMRRWLRTLPCYYLTLALAFGAALLHWVAPPEMRLRMYILFLQNLAWPHPGFFGEAWSLATEEWFYLLLPPGLCLGLWLAPRARRPAVLLAWALLLIAAATAYRSWLATDLYPFDINAWDGGLRKVVLTRLDALGYGVLGVCLHRLHPRLWQAWAPALLALGLALLALDRCYWITGYAHLFYVRYLALGAAPLAALLLLPAASGWRASQWPVMRCFVFISRISYPLYLVHLSLVLNVLLPGIFGMAVFQPAGAVVWLHFAVYWLAAFGLAWLMHAFWEQPFMRLRDRWFPARPAADRKPALAAGVAT